MPTSDPIDRDTTNDALPWWAVPTIILAVVALILLVKPTLWLAVYLWTL